MEAPSDNLYMTDLPLDATAERITEVFSLYGTVVSARVLSGGTALVRFESVEEAESIVTQMSGAVPLGFEEPVTIKFADRGAQAQAAQPQAAQPQAAQVPGYGKWKMAEKKLSTPWSIPGAGTGSPKAAAPGGKGPGGKPPATPALLSALGATSTASKGKGKAFSKPTPLPLPVPEPESFDDLAAAYAAGNGDVEFAAPPQVEFAAPLPQGAEMNVAGVEDDFDSLFAAYSSGQGDEDFGQGEAVPAAAAPVGWSAPSAAAPTVSWSIPAAAAAPDGAWAAPPAAAPAAGGWAVPCAGAPAGGWAVPNAAAAFPADVAAWNGEGARLAAPADVSPWDAEEAAWLAAGPGAAEANGEAQWGGEGAAWSGGGAAAVAGQDAGAGDWGAFKDPPPSDNLYIKGLPIGIDENWLTEALSGIGTVTSVKILAGNGQETTTCAALARFDSVESATTVKDILHGQSPEWCPGKIVARFAIQKGGGGGGGPGEHMPAAADAWMTFRPPAAAKGGEGGKGGKGGKGGDPDSKGEKLCTMVLETSVLPGDAHRSPEGSIYVAGLPGDTSEKHVYQLFAPFGAIISIFTKVGKGGRTGDWAIAFVNYVEPMSAMAAIQVYNGFQLPDGSVMKVNLKQGKGVLSQPLQQPVQQKDGTFLFHEEDAAMAPELSFEALQGTADTGGSAISAEQIEGLLVAANEAAKPLA